MFNSKNALMLGLVCAMTLSASQVAAQAKDIEGSADHPAISRFAESVIVGYSKKEFDEYVLATGKQIRNENDEFVLSDSIRLEGKITRICYKAPKERSTLEVLRSYQNALENAGFEILFTCSGRECGDFFQRTQPGPSAGYALEGGDRRYLSAKLVRATGDVYVSLHLVFHDYIINDYIGHIMAQLDVIEVAPMQTDTVTVNAEAMDSGIMNDGHIALYGIYFDSGKSEILPKSDPTLGVIAEFLKANPSLEVYIVGHTDNLGALDSNMVLSEQRAQSVGQALVDRFEIAADRLTGKGVGPLSPVAPNTSEPGRALNRRVEMVAK